MYVGVSSKVVSVCMWEWVGRWGVHVCGNG